MKKTQCKDGKRSKGPNMKRSKRGQILTKDEKKSPSDLDVTLSVLLGVAQSSERIPTIPTMERVTTVRALCQLPTSRLTL